MKNFLAGIRTAAQISLIIITVVVVIDFLAPSKEFVYPSSQKLEAQGFKKLPGESPQEHEQRGRSVIDYARSMPG